MRAGGRYKRVNFTDILPPFENIMHRKTHILKWVSHDKSGTIVINLNLQINSPQILSSIHSQRLKLKELEWIEINCE